MLNGETVIYVGNLYEKKVVGATTTHTKYYYFGGRRIAMRVAGTLSWLLSDHLGSTTVTADGATGARTAELWYKPWGESRGTAFGVTPTARRFTGQTLDGEAGGSGTFGSRRYGRWRSARSAKTLAAARLFVGFVDLRDFVFQTPGGMIRRWGGFCRRTPSCRSREIRRR